MSFAFMFSPAQRSVFCNTSTLSLSLAALLTGPARAQTGPGYALGYPGTSAYVSVGTGVIPGSGDFTVECWAQAPSATASARQIISQGPGATYFNIGVDSLNKISLGSSWISPGVAFPFTNWHHFAVVKSSTNTLLFIDGVLRANHGFAIANPGAGELRFGNQRAGFNEYWQGQIDETRIWNTARTQSQLTNNMNRTLVGNEFGLVGYWRFDEGTGNFTFDASPSGATGSLLSSPAWVTSAVPFVPDLFTSSASSITATSATLNGSVNPGNLASAAWFQWGRTTSYGNATVASSLPAVNAALALSAPLTGLALHTLYHYRVAATNSAGTNFGGDLTFTSLSVSPTTITQAPTDVSTNAATFNGSVNPNGSSATAWFDWGITTSYGNSTSFNNVGGGTPAVPVSVTVTGLTPGVLYHYRVAATNAIGANFGGDQGFVAGNIVTTLADSGAGSLRQSIAQAAAGSTITFATNGTILVSDGFNISKPLAIVGPGADALALQGISVATNALLGATIFTNQSGSTFISGLSLKANGSPPARSIYNYGTLTLTQVTVTRDPASNYGNGIYNQGMLTMIGCTVIYLIAFNESVILNDHFGILTLTDCTVSGNVADGDLGALGNGIFSISTTLTRCTISGNIGSGILNQSGTLTLTGCTISGNSGAGIGANDNVFSGGGDATLTACTVSGNGVGISGPIGIGQAFHDIRNTLVALNSGGDVQYNVSSDGYNFIGSATNSYFTNGVNGDLVGTAAAPLDPMLGPLTNNGGGTWTHALLAGSPAIDKGKSFGVTVDQRGAPRPYDFASIANASGGDGSDVGAFELGNPKLNIQKFTTNAVLSWPSYYGDFTLQSVGNVAASNSWADVPGTAVVVSDQYVLTNGPVSSSRFYRLKGN